MQSKGFTYFARSDARVLILGSLPGQKSLAAHEYYAHPQNKFWRIMGKLAGAGPELPYKTRVARLNENGIALWDVCAEAFRPGSLDLEIKSAVPNDFAAFFRAHKHIRLICFNGSKAYELYRRKVLPGLPEAAQKILHVVLPSTSPAHAGMRFEEKLEKWRVVLRPYL